MNPNDTRINVADLADLASEFWKLLRNYDRLVEAAPENLRPGLVAQAKFGTRRLSVILERAGLSLETFDGQIYSSNLPVIAVNADDFSDGPAAVIEQTLEPAVIVGTTTIKIGRVYLSAAAILET